MSIDNYTSNNSEQSNIKVNISFCKNCNCKLDQFGYCKFCQTSSVEAHKKNITYTKTKEDKKLFDELVFESDSKLRLLSKVKCTGCGVQGVLEKIVQTRAADEAPTVYHICKHCRHISVIKH